MTPPQDITGAALIVVDMQYDFLPQGALAVAGGDRLITVINRIVRIFRGAMRPIAWTLDDHPAHHVSFVSQGGPWPPHCIHGTRGQALAASLATDVGDGYFYKGNQVGQDAYSGFDGHTRQGQSLAEWLQARRVQSVYIVGLATDYCVKATALDAARLGWRTYVAENAVAAVKVHPDDEAQAWASLATAGVVPVRL